MEMTRKSHWEDIYKRKLSDEVSWYQAHLDLSLELVARSGITRNAKIIDVGGGDSTLVDDLLGNRFANITVVDLSIAALARAKERVEGKAKDVRWIEADITRLDFPASNYDLWHDRAVFHFLTEPVDRVAYINALKKALKTPGYLIIATFAPDGPEQCSGLPTVRYSSEGLQRELGSSFELIEARNKMHLTPAAKLQSFVYCLFRRRVEGHST